MIESKKDLILLCISSTGITYIHIWPAIFAYFTSHCFYKNQDTEINTIYSSFFLYTIGQLLGSIIFPYTFFILGTTMMYIVFAILELFMGYFSQNNVSFIAVSFMQFEKGLLFQGIMTASNIILSEKYQNGILLGKYVMTTRVLSSVLVVFICQFMVNPNNESQNIKSDLGDSFFSKQIAENFEFFFLLYSIASVLIIMLPCVMIDSPKNYKCKLKKYMKYLCGQDNFDFQVVQDVTSCSNIYDSFDQSILQNKQIIERSQSLATISKNSLLEQTDNNGDISKFLINILGYILAINMAIVIYTSQIYKYIALLLKFDDLLISTIFVFGTIFNIISCYVAAYLWNNFGFDITILTLILSNIINLLGIVFIKDYFLFEIFIARSTFAYLLIFQDLFCYTLFDTQEAMQYTKKFVFFNTFGNLIQSILNYTLFTEKRYKIVFEILLILIIVCLFLYIKYLKGKIKKDQYNF